MENHMAPEADLLRQIQTVTTSVNTQSVAVRSRRNRGRQPKPGPCLRLTEDLRLEWAVHGSLCHGTMTHSRTRGEL